MGKILPHICIGNNFFNTAPVAQQVRQNFDKCNDMKLKTFGTVKKTFTELKRQPWNGREIFAVCIFARDQ
jgi:hypothetical protein